ncbi:MAG: glycosyltransferase [Nitrosomonadales bacterium]|nr:glycosyltransferase [Nitrosomonadales bacterium]
MAITSVPVRVNEELRSLPVVKNIHPVRVVIWGTYDSGKPRVRILERGLRENGVEVICCHCEVWRGVEDKSQVKGLARKAAIAFKWLSAYPSLLYNYLRLPKHDVVIVPYLGHLDVLVLWPFARLRGVPIVWDAFLSLYNTIVEDRRLLGACNPLAKLIWVWEWLACRAARRVVLDTRAHGDYFAQTFHVPGAKMASVFVGAEPEVFPCLDEQPAAGMPPVVLFYGQFIPLHGIDTIINAARIARHEPIEWTIIGSGQEAARIRELLDADPLPRLKWIPWVEYGELSDWLRRATVCLGIFGDTDKAARVIPNKVFQILMSGKPLVTRDSIAMRELVAPGHAGVWLVPPADPGALLDAVRAAIQEPVHGGLHGSLRERISPRAIGASLLAVMNDIGAG